MWTRRRKFNNQRVQSHDGYSFASKGEAGLYDYLKLREAAGEIRDLKTQVSVYLTLARILYKPDFSYWDVKKDAQEWAEYKGFETPEWRIKRRLWQHYGPGRLLVFKGRGASLTLSEEILGDDVDGEETNEAVKERT